MDSTFTEGIYEETVVRQRGLDGSDYSCMTEKLLENGYACHYKKPKCDAWEGRGLDFKTSSSPWPRQLGHVDSNDFFSSSQRALFGITAKLTVNLILPTKWQLLSKMTCDQLLIRASNDVSILTPPF